MISETEGMMFKLYCYRCGHFWSSRAGKFPKMCPRCKSSCWDTPVRKRAVCGMCGNEWQMSKMDEACPSCGRSRFDGDPGMLRCNQCDHVWMKRVSGKLPNKCPVCRSMKWNEEKASQVNCRACGHVWRTGVEKPKRCPKCQSARWNAPLYKLQCRRCGHKWMTKEERRSEDIKMCPSCKSRKWNEVPEPLLCRKCNTYYIGTSRGNRCPACNAKEKSVRAVCEFCKTAWISISEKIAVCPRCGKPGPGDRADKVLDIWSDGKLSLRYVHTDEFGFIYLWEDDRPAAAMYFHDLLNKLKINADQFAMRLSDPEYRITWKEISYEMYEHRDDFRENTSYFIRRLSLCEFDASVLSLHFTGMGVEAIAMKFKVPVDDVRMSFDRIMAAYTDNGIIVNDSIFTDDPFSFY